MESPATLDQATSSGLEFFARARARLTLEVPAGLRDAGILPRRGDHDIDPVMQKIAATRPIRPAAVLVPIVDRDEPMVLLTQRAAHLKDHGGQISFPGGKIEATDASPAAAAIREAQEEIGLAPQLIEPLGYLDLYLTTLGYRIVPTLARVAPDFRLRLNHEEVEDSFEVPLAFLMAPENHQRHSRDWNGMTRSFYAMPFGERYIWGATAGILRNLYERIYAA
ncbi:MAG TPA: CoA pyrophosphatase [Xanthobacteraceae bacterium]|jgi:8-oxo-dGTP pyrophosphatase MutT (NUDIX family)